MRNFILIFLLAFPIVVYADYYRVNGDIRTRSPSPTGACTIFYHIGVEDGIFDDSWNFIYAHPSKVCQYGYEDSDSGELSIFNQNFTYRLYVDPEDSGCPNPSDIYNPVTKECYEPVDCSENKGKQHGVGLYNWLGSKDSKSNHNGCQLAACGDVYCFERDLGDSCHSKICYTGNEAAPSDNTDMTATPTIKPDESRTETEKETETTVDQNTGAETTETTETTTTDQGKGYILRY